MPLIRPHVVIGLTALAAITLATWAMNAYRVWVARLPEIGRATPIEDLRAAWAEAEETPAKRTPFTMPQPKTENRP